MKQYVTDTTKLQITVYAFALAILPYQCHENVICFLCLLQMFKSISDYFSHGSISMNPDQTAPIT